MIATDSAPCAANLEELAGDAELLAHFVTRGDQHAFELLVRRHWPRLLHVCQRLLRDAHAAEDACQATFLVFVRRAPSIAQPELLSSWLHGVARRIASKMRARAARQRVYDWCSDPASTADPLLEVVQREQRSVLVSEMERLPEKFRAPLRLCYLECHTNVEAARRLGCPAGSMSYRLARGRELLRHRLTHRATDGIRSAS